MNDLNGNYCTKLTNVIGTLNCLVLVIITSVLLWKGPISAVISDKTIFKEDFNSKLESPIRWPGISICRSPIFKNKSAFEDLMSKFESTENISDTEFNASLEKTYLTNPTDTVLAVSIAQSYPEAILLGKPELIPIQSPYVTSTFIDYHYNGYCTVISYSELVKYLVNEGKTNLKNVEEDGTFFTVFWLKGIEEPNAFYTVNMYPDYEHILGPASTIFKPSKVTIQNSKFEAFLFNFELRDCIGMCKRTNQPLSPCVQKYYDSTFGHSFINASKKADMMKKLKLHGQMYVKYYSKCSVPCVIYEYSMIPFVSQHIDYLIDGSTKYLKTINETNGSVLVIGHIPLAQIKTFKEVYQYTGLSFISDTGGIVGIFLGFSIISIYEELIKPLIWKISKRFRL